MTIREMSEQDLDAVSSIEKSIFSRPWSKQSFYDAIMNPNNIYLVVENKNQNNNEIIGYCGLWGIAGEGQINNVAVAKPYRGRHVGTLMLKELLEKGRLGGLSEFYLEVRISNSNARKLYQNLGFEEVGIRRDFYELPKEDAVIMHKS